MANARVWEDSGGIFIRNEGCKYRPAEPDRTKFKKGDRVTVRRTFRGEIAGVKSAFECPRRRGYAEYWGKTGEFLYAKVLSGPEAMHQTVRDMAVHLTATKGNDSQRPQLMEE